MLGSILAWFETRASIKQYERLRANQAKTNVFAVEGRLSEIHRMMVLGTATKEAERLFEAVYAEYPYETNLSSDTVRILVGLRRFDEAERLIRQGLRRSPDSREFAFFQCHLADHRPDLHERLRRWQGFHRRFPADPGGFLFVSRALRDLGRAAEAERLLGKAVRSLPLREDIVKEYALYAAERQDGTEAIRRWALLRDEVQQPRGPLEIARIHTREGRYDQADAELVAGRLLFPLAPELIEQRAHLAETRGETALALALWQELRRDFPQVIAAYVEAARLLRDRGTISEAEDLVSEAAVRATTDVDLQAQAAAIAERRGDWATAGRCWACIRAVSPQRQDAHLHEARAYHAMSLHEDARTVLREAAALFGQSADFQRDGARLAEAWQDWRLAAAFWQGAVALEADSASAHAALARAWRCAGEVAEARAVLAAALDRWPDDVALLQEAGRSGA